MMADTPEGRQYEHLKREAGRLHAEATDSTALYYGLLAACESILAACAAIPDPGYRLALIGQLFTDIGHCVAEGRSMDSLEFKVQEAWEKWRG